MTLPYKGKLSRLLPSSKTVLRPAVMQFEQFLAAGERLGKDAGAEESCREYFVGQASRLYETCQLFGLFDAKLGDALEIGPYYGYTPFFLRQRASSYTVLEGDDPESYPLKPLYQKHAIAVHFVDLFESFGPVHHATRVLPFADATFDNILCWETMEHFNFNPVAFVRELHRVLKPGGRIYITVPNRASFQSLSGLIFGKDDKHRIDQHFTYENHHSNGKLAWYGFHWYEYTRTELEHLFTRVGFKGRCNTFVTFQNIGGKTSMLRKVARVASRSLGRLLRRYGTNVYLIAQKQ